VQPDIRVALDQRRPLRQRVLNPVLAEVALASFEQWLNLIGRSALADGDELDIGGITLGQLGSSSDAIQNLLASVGGTAHRTPL
jgi:hypothetical protein